MMETRRLGESKVKLGAIALARGKTLANLAIAWVLRQPGMTGAIIGIRGEEDARKMSGGLG
jgi:L-glyceraldehyde 3-phosphate reductase